MMYFYYQTTNLTIYNNFNRRKLKKKLEIISIIESTRKKYNLGLPQEQEFEKYNWVIKGFHKELLIPKQLKHKIIFYSNRCFPNAYLNYRKLFKK